LHTGGIRLAWAAVGRSAVSAAIVDVEAVAVGAGTPHCGLWEMWVQTKEKMEVHPNRSEEVKVTLGQVVKTCNDLLHKGRFNIDDFFEWHCKVEMYGRITTPYRKKIGERKVILFCPEERYVAGYLPENAGRWAVSKDKAKSTATDIVEIELDYRGRMTIPAKLRRHAGIASTVVFLGTDEYFELWGERHWELERAGACAEAADLCRAKAVHKTR